MHETYKRCFDLLAASAALLVFAPVMLVVAVLVKLTSPGPLLFRQERLTRHERPFHVLKFRTMVDNAEAKTGPVWAGRNDARITPLGNILRKTHLDELPQLFNVLNGDMSFIGPRPERAVFVNQFKAAGIPNYSLRHLTKTGITGYAQLQNSEPSLDSLDDIRAKTEADLWYIQHWSPLLDLWIVWQTTLHFATSILYTVLRVEASADRHF
ncbi:MAG: sugar transferase [Candidatus Melainabacteria bacterium]